MTLPMSEKYAGSLSGIWLGELPAPKFESEQLNGVHVERTMPRSPGLGTATPRG